MWSSSHPFSGNKDTSGSRGVELDRSKVKLFENQRLRTEFDDESIEEAAVVGSSTDEVHCSKDTEATTQIKIVRLVESKYIQSTMRSYRFPRTTVNGSQDLLEDEASLESLRNAGPYNLRTQNLKRAQEKLTNKLQSLDFTKLQPKKVAGGQKSERQASRPQTKQISNCHTSRHQRESMHRDSTEKPSNSAHTKAGFLKGFLKQLKLAQDNGSSHPVAIHPSKFKLFAGLKVPQRGQSREPSPRGATSRKERDRSAKPQNIFKEASRKDMLLKYLRDSRISVDKLQLKSSKTNSRSFNRPVLNFSKLSLNKKPLFTAAPTGLPLSRGLQTSKSKKTIEKEKPDHSLKRLEPHKLKSKSKDKTGNTASVGTLSRNKQPRIREAKSFHQGSNTARSHLPKQASSPNRSGAETGRQRPGNSTEKSIPLHPKHPNSGKMLIQSQSSTKFTSITKLTINKQKAYLNLNEHRKQRPMTDRKPTDSQYF